MRRNSYKWIQGAGAASSVGILLVVSTTIGFFLGWWLDGKFGTTPWLTLLFTILGIVGGFIEIFRIVKRLSEDDEQQ